MVVDEDMRMHVKNLRKTGQGQLHGTRGASLMLSALRPIKATLVFAPRASAKARSKNDRPGIYPQMSFSTNKGPLHFAKLAHDAGCLILQMSIPFLSRAFAKYSAASELPKYILG